MRKYIKLFLTPALLLSVTVFAGCSQAGDALPCEGGVARGGEPLTIRIAPKPGYAESTNTRATVSDDTGAFAWEEYDKVSVRLIFNDAANTTLCHSWSYLPVNDTGFSYYIPGWSTTDEVQGGRPISELVWPLGASSVTVNAFHGDMSMPNYIVGKGPDFAYNPGQTGDYMLFSKTLTLGEDLTVDFVHGTARLVFTGLAPNTSYSLKAAGTELTFPKSLSDDLSAFDVMEAQAFTSDAGGNLTVCADLDDKIDANGKLTLELVTGGATVYQATLTAQGTAGAYKMDGYIYKIKVGGTGGEVHPGNYTDLIKVPAPIAPGNKVYELSGYYITVPDADATKTYQWAASESATAMDNNPCVGHGKWRLPTMKEFEKLSGTYGNYYPWSQSEVEDFRYPGCALDALLAFGHEAGSYWSSDVADSPTASAWVMACNSTTDSSGIYGWAYKRLAKTATAMVRCVQPM